MLSDAGDTYYVWNVLGQLRFVLTPAYNKKSASKTMFAYEYRYDNRGRMVMKILPRDGSSGSTTQYWYDRADRMAYMRDHALGGRYRFFLYDRMGRLCVQGTCSGGNLSDTIRTTTAYRSGTAGISGTGYTAPYAITDPRLETVSYYDNYDFIGQNMTSAMPSVSVSDSQRMYSTGFLMGQVVYATNGEALGTVNVYDQKGHVVRSVRRGLGSTRMVVGSDNSVKETVSYYPFGSEMRMQAPAQMGGDTRHPFRFTGKELDRQNGLNWYDFGARWYDVAGVPMWTSVDPLAEKYYNVSPYVYCAGDPVNRFDPDGRDWYWDTDRTLQYNPNVHSAKDLQKGQEYVGETYSTKFASFRNDGSILFNNETKAYNRMWDQANRHYRSKGESGGRESGAYILEDGKVLVLPEYENDSWNAFMDTGGYLLKNGRKLIHGKESFFVVGQVHTHQNKRGDPTPSIFDAEEGYGDLGFSEANNSLPVFTMGWDGKVHGIRGYRNQNGRMAGSVVTMRKNEKNLSGLLKGSYSLRSVIRRLPKLVK